jgi:lactate dehydrogenase-like 2-hydroxyacid dehydrogenase
MKICILDAKTLGNDIDLSVFNKFGEVVIYDMTTQEQVVERIKDQEIIIANKVLLNESNLQYAPKVKLICITATGTNNVDLRYAKQRQIAVTNAAGYSTKSVVQHTFAMLFYVLEHLAYYDDYVKSGEYQKSDMFCHLDRSFSEIEGLTWGIIGLGTIGKSVAKIASAFGANIVYYSTSGSNNNQEYTRMDLERLLEVSDIVSIHAPLNPQTDNLLDYKRLYKMKKSAILVNVGRGGIVNEKDLAQILLEDRIAGAALDVLQKEPMTNDNPLLQNINSSKLFITPHIAWASAQARTRLIHEIVLNIEAFLSRRERNRVC